MIKTYVVPVTADAQNLLTAIAAAYPPPAGMPVASLDLACRALWLSGRGTNNAAIYLGDSVLVSSTNYGIRLEPGDLNNNPSAPFTAGEFGTGPLKFSDFWFAGADGEFLHILAVPF